MTDPSLQKMQTTPESNVQKMHIPAEWVEAGSRAAAAANNDNPDFLGYQQNKPNWQLWSPCIEAALAAVIPLVREDERERLAKLFEAGLLADGNTSADIAAVIRAQGRA